MKRLLLVTFILMIGVTIAAAQSQVKKETVAGITNLSKIESTVACAGAVTPGSVAEIKKMGFKSIFNLRQESEPGVDIAAEADAAKAAGINFYHLPINGAQPDLAVVDRFLKTIKESGNEPAFIHCASGNRAAALWFIKRSLVDKWDQERAMKEATDLGLTSAGLKTFAIDYVQKHK
jgi:uncharacterized protein (TIGR01244 family)